MEKIGKPILWMITFLFSAVMAWAAPQVNVQATVDRDQMGIGDSFTLNIRVQVDDDVQLTAPQVPSIAGLELLNSWSGGSQTSSNMSIINGKTQFTQSVSQDFNYQFSPQKEGTYSIPMIDVQVAGQSYKTAPIKIEVKEAFRNAGKKRAQKIPGRPQYNDDESNPFSQMQDPDDLFNQLMQQRQRLLGQIQNGGQPFGGNQQAQQIPSLKFDVNTNEAFFIHVDLDKTEVYEGEQITANWFIYTRGQLETLDRVKFPDLKGFWKEIIEEVPSLQFSQVLVNGIAYQRALLASHALFPIKAGSAVIDEFRIKGKVRLPTQFGYGQSREWTKSSRRTVLKVLPLPLEGKTQSFSGAVGSYRISVKTDGTSFPAHQPFSIKVRFEGTGNAKLIDLPPIAWPESLEVYDTKNESKFFKDGQSFKEFEILVIPRKEGELPIPSMSFSYFDPAQKKYLTENTQALVLNITPGNPQSAPNVAAGGVVKTGSDEATVYKTQPILELPQSSVLFATNRINIYFSLAILIFMSLTANFLLQMKKLYQEPEFQKTVADKMKVIEQSLEKSDHKKIGSEALNLVYVLAASLAGQRRADQEWSELIKEIPVKAKNQFLDRLSELFDYFQLLGFSPENVVQQLLKQKPIENQIADLKKIAKEIVSKTKADDQE